MSRAWVKTAIVIIIKSIINNRSETQKNKRNRNSQAQNYMKQPAILVQHIKTQQHINNQTNQGINPEQINTVCQPTNNHSHAKTFVQLCQTMHFYHKCNCPLHKYPYNKANKYKLGISSKKQQSSQNYDSQFLTMYSCLERECDPVTTEVLRSNE